MSPIYPLEKLGNLGSILKNKAKENESPYIEIGDIDLQSKKYLLKNKPSVKGAIFANKNSVLISKVRPTRGAISLVEEEKIVVSSAFFVILPTKILPKLLFYFLAFNKDFLSHLGSKSKGTLYPSCKEKDIIDYEIPLPPLETQQLIVAEIEKQFSRLDDGLNSLKKIKASLKNYKASKLNNIFSSHPRNKWKTLREIVTSVGQGWSPKCENFPANENEWGVIKTTAVQPIVFDGVHNKKLPDSLKPRKELELKEGDLLMTRAGPRVRVGIVCIIKDVRPNLICCDKVYRIKVDLNDISPEYLNILLNSPLFQNKIDQIKTGINDSGLNITQDRLLNLDLPVPDIGEQQAIVRDIESQLSTITEIEQMIDQNIKRAENMKQAILKKAFSGELIN